MANVFLDWMVYANLSVLRLDRVYPVTSTTSVFRQSTHGGGSHNDTMLSNSDIDNAAAFPRSGAFTVVV